jgi:hypothetical protein
MLRIAGPPPESQTTGNCGTESHGAFFMKVSRATWITLSEKGVTNMKKLGFLMAAIWAISLLIMPQKSFAKMTVMSDSELKAVTGQAGITIHPEIF